MIWIDFPEEPHKIWSKMVFAHYTSFIFSIISVILKVIQTFITKVGADHFYSPINSS